MNSARSSVMLDETPRMPRFVPRLVALASVVLAAQLLFAQPAKPAPKPAPKPSSTRATKPPTKLAVRSVTAPSSRSASKPETKAGKKTATKTTTKPGKKVPKNAPVLLVHINRHEEMSLRMRDAQGRPIKGLQRRFDRFLRCHHTNKQHAINPRLMRLLYQIGKHWPGKKLEVVSGYRDPTVAKNPRSPHMQGQACDFRVEGVKAADLRDYLRRAFEKVGVGYYPNSSFVHLDVRKDRSAFWIDYSGPGERSVYSATPNEDLRNGRADNYHPTKIDASWANEGEIGTAPTGGAAPSAEGSGVGAAQAPAAVPQGDP
jgi:uncharacterized protein YcbK (DUF882 family)